MEDEINWLKRAAELDHEDSIEWLSEMLVKGIITEESLGVLLSKVVKRL